MRLSGRKADAVRASTKRLPVPLTSSNERRPLSLQLNETMGDGTLDGSGGLSRATSTSNCQTSSTTSPTTMGGSTASSSHTMTGTQHHGEVGVHRGLLEVVPYPRGTPHRVLLSTRTRQIALVVTPPEELPSTETDISKPALDIENLDPDAILLWTEGGHLVGTRGRGPIASRIDNPLRDRSGLCKRLGTVAAWRQPSTDADTLRGHRVLHLVGEGSKPDSMPSPSQSFVSSRPAEDNAPTGH
jgi:hypothetical protein